MPNAITLAQQFVPLLDEETGAVRAGIRWWQVKPISWPR